MESGGFEESDITVSSPERAVWRRGKVAVKEQNNVFWPPKKINISLSVRYI